MKVVRSLSQSELEYLSGLQEKAQDAVDRANEYTSLLQQYARTLTEEGEAIDLERGAIIRQGEDDELPEDEE